MRFGGEDMAALPHLSLGFASATNEAQMGDVDFRAARRKPNSVKEDDLNLYVTLFISSLCAIAAEHGVTSSVQTTPDPAVRNPSTARQNTHRVVVRWRKPTGRA